VMSRMTPSRRSQLPPVAGRQGMVLIRQGRLRPEACTRRHWIVTGEALPKARVRAWPIRSRSAGSTRASSQSGVPMALAGSSPSRK